MDDKKQNLPALSKQVTELVLAGSIGHAEQAFSEAADQFGDLAVVEVLDTIPPQVTSLHLAAFDGGKPSLASLLVSPKAWAQSLAFFAATWSDDLIEMDPERLAEALFAHIHGVVFATDDSERRHELMSEAGATDWGSTAFATVFSLAPKEIHDVAHEIALKGTYVLGQSQTDNEIVPLAVELARASEEGWDRALYELFPNFRHADLGTHDEHDEHDDRGDKEEAHHDYETFESTHRSTKELLYRLRKQVPSVRTARTPRRKSLGTDIFS